MGEENLNAPQEGQVEQPMMTFNQLETMVNEAKEAEPQQDKGEEVSGQTPPDVQGQVEDPINKVLADTGFKSVEELAKSQKEGHATITKLAQERAALQRDLEALAAFPNMIMKQMKGQPGQPEPQPVQPQGQADSLTAELYKDMAPYIQQEIERRAAEIASNVVDQKISMRELGGRVNAKRSENPEEFDELRPIMVNLLQNNPHYEAHPKGLDIVYDMAKQVRDQRIAKITSKIFGEDVSVDKVREALKLVMGGQPAQPAMAQPTAQPGAYVPPSSATTPPMTQRPKDYDQEIKSIMTTDRIARDTPDKVLDLWWQKVTQSQSNNIRR